MQEPHERPDAEILRELQEHLREEPFAAFNIRLVNGDTLGVPERDLIWLPKTAPAFFTHCTNEGSVRVIRLTAIVSFEIMSPTG